MSKTPRTDDESTLAAMVRELDAKLAAALAAKERAEEAERSLSEQVKAMDAALADAERDAKRYRWLRTKANTWHVRYFNEANSQWYYPMTDKLDAAIDAARGVKS